MPPQPRAPPSLHPPPSPAQVGLPEPAPMGDVPSEPMQVAHALVAQYLTQLGYTRTLAAFEQDAAQAGAPGPAPASLPEGLTLPSLAELYLSRARAQAKRAQRKAVRNPLAALLPGPGGAQDDDKPWALAPGPVWSHIHGANILSLQPVFLPRHSFDLASAALRTSFTFALASSAADRRVAFTQLEGLPDGGTLAPLQRADIRAEVVDALEGFHGGAILSVAQPLPSGATSGTSMTHGWRTNQLPGRLLATGGMDGRVVLTDLLQSGTTPIEARKVQILSDHSKFVTRVAFSADGSFFASAGYDKQIHLYALNAQGTPFAPGSDPYVPDPDAPLDAEEPLPMKSVEYTRIHTIRTGSSNPETILFVPAQTGPGAEDGTESDEEDGDEEQEGEARRGEPEFYTGRGTVGGQRVHGRRRRAWLVYTVRGDSDVHYIALPELPPALEDQVANLQVDDAQGRPIRDFEHIAYNTNAHRLDRHSSYSIVETSLHPSGAYLSLQTGPAESTALGLVGSEGAGGHSSRIILLPLHADGTARAADLWTGVTVSSLGVTRHAWTPSGRRVIVAGEDGWLRCLDLQGRIRASMPIHGSAASDPSLVRQAHVLTDARQTILSDAPTETRERSAALMRQSLAWSRGQINGSAGSGGNTAIRGLVALNDTCVLSAGFDRTVRLTFLGTEPGV